MSRFYKLFNEINFQDKFFVFILTLIISSYIFIFNILIFYNQGISENEENYIFITSWLSVPIISILLLLLLEYIRQRNYSNFFLYYASLVIFNLILLNILILSLRILSIDYNLINTFNSFIVQFDFQVPFHWEGFYTLGYKLNISYQFLLISIILVFVANFIFFYFIFLLNNTTQNQKKFDSLYSAFSILYPTLILLILFNFSKMKLSGIFGDTDGYNIAQPYLFLIVATLAIFSQYHIRFFKFIESIKPISFFNLLLCLTIVFLIYDPNLTIEPFHQNHYLGPIIDLRAGKFLLVDIIDSQYGVFNIYLLKFFFDLFPISHKTFSLLTIFLYFVQFVVVYSLLNFVTKSKIYSFLSLLLIIYFNYFTHYIHVHQYPASGPIRFLPALLIIFFEVEALKNLKFKNYYYILIAILIGISSISGFDYFIFSFFTFLCMRLYKIVIMWPNYTIIKNNVIYLFISIFFCIFFHFIFNIYTYFNTGIFPTWQYYIDYLVWYKSTNEWMVALRPFSNWIYFILIPLCGIYLIFFLIIFKVIKNFDDQFFVISGFIGLSISQFTYFLGRSHLENLFHISIPSIFILLIGIYLLSKKYYLLSKGHFRSLIYCTYFILFFAIIKISPNVYNNFFHNPGKSRIYYYDQIYSNLQQAFNPKPSSNVVKESITLIKKYSNDNNRIGVFLDTYDNTEVLMFTNKASKLPYNFLPQATRFDSLKKNIINQIDLFENEEIIYGSFICDSYEEYNLSNHTVNSNNKCDRKKVHGRTLTMYSKIFDKINKKFDLTVIETSENGISAVKLIEKQN